MAVNNGCPAPAAPKPQPTPKTVTKTKPQCVRTRVLVTGGAGFVGSHLCTTLVARGDFVICLDNFFTGSKDNVAHLLDSPNFELIRHDVVEKILLEVDQVYHLACPASPVHYKYNPIKSIKTSFMGTMNMLGLAKVRECGGGRRLHHPFLCVCLNKAARSRQQHPPRPRCILSSAHSVPFPAGFHVGSVR